MPFVQKSRILSGFNLWYLGIYLIFLAGLLSSSLFEYRSRYRDLRLLMEDQAAVIASVISVAGSGQSRLSEEIEQLYVDRALDLLSSLNRLEAGGGLREELVLDLAAGEPASGGVGWWA